MRKRTHEEVLAWQRENREFFRLSCMVGAARATVRNAKSAEERAAAEEKLQRLEQELAAAKKVKEVQQDD